MIKNQNVKKMLFKIKLVTKIIQKRLFKYKSSIIKIFIMKKSICILSLALVMLGNVALASNVSNNSSKNAFSYVASDVNPLCIAISKGDLNKVKEIIAYGVDVNDTTNRGMTPLMYAALYNQSEIVKLLLENGANIYMKDNLGKTALDHAKVIGSEAIIKILKEDKKRK